MSTMQLQILNFHATSANLPAFKAASASVAEICVKPSTATLPSLAISSSTRFRCEASALSKSSQRSPAHSPPEFRYLSWFDLPRSLSIQYGCRLGQNVVALRPRVSGTVPDNEPRSAFSTSSLTRASPANAAVSFAVMWPCLSACGRCASA